MKPDESSSEEKEALVNQHGINTIIDLRSKSAFHSFAVFDPSLSPKHRTEHIQKAKKHTSTAAIEIPSISYRYISLNGPSFERALLWRLPWLSMAKLIALMGLGYRLEAISIIGTQVMEPRGLTGLAFDTLAMSTAEIEAVCMLFADEAEYPIMIHCTQGKDRTGLAIVLMLLLLEVPVQAIATDYVASERELEVELEERTADMRKVGLGRDFAGCPSGFVEAVVSELDSKYGGVKSYLEDKVGISEEIQEKIRSIMLVRWSLAPNSTG
jgi:protein-tyrosine phosphatase